ncbi:MAG: translocation/assembly module TamB domain-containing protein [Bacteroidaceae bacterium]|nr:translocation/assembly module TamB domain-containing protein [Bacteroidaceae bacterium]
MRRTKRFLQWLVGIGVGLYLALVLLPAVPVVQRWMAGGVERLLERTLGTEVSVGRVSLSWSGRIVADNLTVWDQRGRKMLRVARMGATLSLRDLIDQRIRIANAQLFGLHADLYRECPECPPNFQFLIDAFASKDTTRHTPLDLRITQLLVRRGDIRWGDSLHLTDLNLTAQLNVLTEDSVNLRVKRLDVCESRGVCIRSLHFDLEGNGREVRLTGLELETAASLLTLEATMKSADGRLIPLKGSKEQGPRGKTAPAEPLRYEGRLRGHLSPTDLAFLLPQARNIDNEADLDVSFRGENDDIEAQLKLNDARGSLALETETTVRYFTAGSERIEAEAEVTRLFVDNRLMSPHLASPLTERLGNATLRGHLTYAQKRLTGSVDASTPLGDAHIEGTGELGGAVKATVQSTGFQLGQLLEHKELGLVALDMKAEGKLGKPVRLNVSGTLPEMDFHRYRYRNVTLDGEIHDQTYKGKVAVADMNLDIEAEGEVDLLRRHYQLKAVVERISPNTLNFTKRYANTTFSGELLADLTGTSLEEMTGSVQLNRFSMTDSLGNYRPGDIHLTSKTRSGGQHIMLISPFLEAQIQGKPDPQAIADHVRYMLSQYLPTERQTHPKSRSMREGGTYATNKTDNGNGSTPSQGGTGDESAGASFVVRAYNAEPLRRMLGIPLKIEGTTIVTGEIDSGHKAFWMKLKSHSIHYASEQLKDVDVRLESDYESVFATAETKRMMKGKWVTFGMDTQGHEGKLTTRLYFNNHAQPAYAGDLNLVSRLWKDPEGRQGFDGEILPSNFLISDTLWTIHPGALSYYDKSLRVDSFAVSQGDRFIHLNGRASQLETDTLHAQLRRINLEYIFSLINFHDVELTGEATGDAYAHSLFSSPKADAYIRIPQFALNYATMGDLDIHINWGNRPYSIFLDGRIMDGGESLTNVSGYITPKKDIEYHGLDLHVNAERVNLGFINMWTDAIFDDLRGRATGWVRIFGPFKQINIEGDAVVNEASMGVPFIGVRYRMENDSVQLRPDNIYFTNARIYDPQGTPGAEGHSAVVNGHLHHNSFKNLAYDIHIQGDNILGYHFTDFGDTNFYGTVYATGDISLKGHPGNVLIGIKARPERGTTFTYNATSPDKLTETPFISYRSKYDIKIPNDSQAPGDNPDEPEEEESKSDLRIDFDLDIDPQSTMNLLMDVRSGDKITLNGTGHMLAHYYNKGAFNLFGTYRVNRGTYNLSLQEIIHKNFDFSPEGSITFNGEPYDADLNLQAVHTVSGVSLNDINPKANFSNTSTRVNCLMNIGGKARAPRITFDFDILNANEDEKQMVKSLISTEEERNMQVIYLLGIGRFYAYDYANSTQTQGATAMNSLLSSTLSGTINQALSNIIGSSNWNFGANLRTGQDGWNDMDVEGMLQGSLLNNRLLINGNFGYRDNPVATSNFIRDFDVKYLLTRSGSVALKAYSETNDRYFTKSSLTTQGIGILLKKDFSSWKDLMGKDKRKKKK